MTDQNQKNIERLSTIFSAVFFCFYFFYLWFIIKPNLIYNTQEPVFFFGIHFFKEFLDHPGGITEYISAFLTQFYIYPIAQTNAQEQTVHDK